MLWYIIYILIFNAFCFTEQLDVNEISGSKSVERKMRVVNNSSSDKSDLRTSINEPISVYELPNNKNNSGKNKNIQIESIAEQKTKLVPLKITDHEKNVTNKVNSVYKLTNNDTSSHIHSEHTKDFTGAALRGFYVFVGLSVVIIFYFIVKSFKLRPGAPPPATIRKYGIIGRRSDLEMLPLPLAEEDDDDTVFDMGIQGNRFSNN